MIGTNRGFTLIELIIAMGIVAVLASISVAVYFNYITITESATVLNEISALEEEVQIAIETGSNGLVQCDDTLVGASNMASMDYLDYTISPLAVDPADPAAGSKPGLIIAARVDKHGSEGIALARTLYEELSNGNNRIVDATLTDTVVTFSVPLSNSPACTTAAASTVATTATAAPAATAVPAATPVQGTLAYRYRSDSHSSSMQGWLIDAGITDAWTRSAHLTDMSVDPPGVGTITPGASGRWVLNFSTPSNPNQPQDFTITMKVENGPPGVDTVVLQGTH